MRGKCRRRFDNWEKRQQGNAMRLSVALSPKCERKWKRIAAYMGKDIDALLVAGIDYVWERFGKDIEQSERQTARCVRKVKQAELSLSRQATKVGGSFLGRFTRKVNEKGIVRLPKCWLDVMASPRKLYGLRHGKQAICLFTENEFEKCDESVKREAAALSVSSSGFVKIDGAVRGFSCANRDVALQGRIRYIQAEVVQAKA